MEVGTWSVQGTVVGAVMVGGEEVEATGRVWEGLARGAWSGYPLV